MRLIISLFLFISLLLQAQEPKQVNKVKLLEPRGYYAIVDSASNKVIRALKYDIVYDFSFDVAIVILNGKYGVIDKQGNEIVKPIYDKIEKFSDGMAVVILNKKYGAINLQGNEITGMKFDYVCEYGNDIAMVKLDKKQGYINKKGEEVCPLIYDEVDFTSIGSENYDLFRVKFKGKYGYINKYGKEVIPPTYFDADNGYSFIAGLSRVRKDTLWGMINKEGKEVIPLKYSKFGEIRNGFICYELKGKWGCLNDTGKVVIPALYDFIYATFHDLLQFEQKGKYGILDKTGKVLIPALYDDIEVITDNIIKVKLKEKYGIVNKLNQPVVAIKYSYIGVSWSNNKPYYSVSIPDPMATPEMFGSKSGIVDFTGKILIPLEYAAVWTYDDFFVSSSYHSNTKGFQNYNLFNMAGQKLFSTPFNEYHIDNNIVYFKNENSTAMYIPKFKKVIPPHTFLFVHDSIIYANKGGINNNGQIQGGKSSLYDMKGTRITPLEYDFISSFSENLAVIFTNGKMGFIDKTGKTVIEPKFGFIFENRFFEDLATVNVGGIYDPQKGLSGGKWGFINKKGELVIPAEYDGALVFRSGVVAVRKENRVGAIDKTGKVVIPFEYQDIGVFENGIAFYVKDNMYGFLDKTGKIITNNIYQGTYGFSEGLAAVSKNNKVGFIDETGKEIIPFEYDNAENFENGYARLLKGNNIVLMNKQGEIIKQAPLKK